MYDRSSKLGQAEQLDCDQSCALTLTFDLPSSLLKSLQLESQVLCKQIRQNANRSAKSPGLCVNSQGLVVKDSQIVVPDHCDEDGTLRALQRNTVCERIRRALRRQCFPLPWS
jgi:hypothetical protein